jgi:hypothetical protein
MLQNGLVAARKNHKDVRLLSASSTVAAPTADVNGFDEWEAVFMDGQGQALALELRRGTLPGTPRPVALPLGKEAFDLPVALDLGEAADRLAESSSAGPFGAITLWWPLYPGNTEAIYEFVMGSGGPNDPKVAVGAQTGLVRPG